MEHTGEMGGSIAFVGRFCESRTTARENTTVEQSLSTGRLFVISWSMPTSIQYFIRSKDTKGKKVIIVIDLFFVVTNSR